MSENVASALTYVLGFITGIIFLVLEPYSKNRAVRFHAFQSIFLSIALIAIRIVLSMLFFSMLSFSLVLLLSTLVGLGSFAIWIFMIVTAYQGKKIVLPVIGPLAEKQA